MRQSGCRLIGWQLGNKSLNRGTVWGKASRPDLWGGRRVTGASTRNLTPEAGAFFTLAISEQNFAFAKFSLASGAGDRVVGQTRGSVQQVVEPDNWYQEHLSLSEDKSSSVKVKRVFSFDPLQVN